MTTSERHKPKVNEVNEFLEIASDFEDPLEVIRESLSNSYDAEATEVDISIKQRPRGSDIVIEDDGNGMSRRDLESFFDLGNSRKTDSIGYKGHGTKIFYKSDRIVVNTSSGGQNLRATMERPWEKLNNRELPEYEVTETETRAGNEGTRIRITGFRSGQGFEPESLTYNKIHHYLKWKTIAGSTAHFFDDNLREMTITVDLDEEIDDTQEKLETSNRFEFPPEQREPSDGEFPARTMCKHYRPREFEIETDQGTSTLQVVGMIGGKEARNMLPTYGRHSAQFGIWLAKDHIKVERVNEVISSDNEFLHFFFVANCQDIELSANREKIRNKSSQLYQDIKDRLRHYISKVAADPWFSDYLDTRRTGEIKRRARAQQSSIEDRQQKITERESFEATNVPEVILGLERSNDTEADRKLTIEDFNNDSEVNAIVREGGELFSSSVHVRLTEHFEADKPLQSVDKIVCWEVGDQDSLSEYQRGKYHGGDVELQLDRNRIIYRNGNRHTVDIVTVKDRLTRTKPEQMPLTDD